MASVAQLYLTRKHYTFIAQVIQLQLHTEGLFHIAPVISAQKGGPIYIASVAQLYLTRKHYTFIAQGYNFSFTQKDSFTLHQ